MTALMTSLCVASIAFYLRFLVALCKECKPRWICYLLRLQPASSAEQLLEPEEEESSLLNAA